MTMDFSYSVWYVPFIFFHYLKMEYWSMSCRWLEYVQTGVFRSRWLIGPPRGSLAFLGVKYSLETCGYSVVCLNKDENKCQCENGYGPAWRPLRLVSSGYVGWPSSTHTPSTVILTRNSTSPNISWSNLPCECYSSSFIFNGAGSGRWSWSSRKSLMYILGGGVAYFVKFSLVTTSQFSHNSSQ